MPLFQLLIVLFGWHEKEECARQTTLAARLSRSDGDVLLKILLLACLNGARAAPLNKRQLKNEIARTYAISIEKVETRIAVLEDLGYLSIKANDDSREVILIASASARADLQSYGLKLAQAVRTLARQLEMPAEHSHTDDDFNLVHALAALTEMEERAPRKSA